MLLVIIVFTTRLYTYFVLIYMFGYSPALFLKKPKKIMDLNLLPPMARGSPKGIASILDKQRMTRDSSQIFKSATRSASNDERPPVHSAVVHHS